MVVRYVKCYKRGLNLGGLSRASSRVAVSSVCLVGCGEVMKASTWNRDESFNKSARLCQITIKFYIYRQ